MPRNFWLTQGIFHTDFEAHDTFSALNRNGSDDVEGWIIVRGESFGKMHMKK